MRPAPLVLRGLALLLVVGAPLAPPLHRTGPGRAVVYVVDRSGSIGEGEQARARRYIDGALAARGEVRTGVVAFGARPSLVLPIGAPTVRQKDWFNKDAPPGTDLAAAVGLAAAALPMAGQRRLVLLTDGRATRGDATAAVARAHAEGVQVDVVPLGGARTATNELTSLEALHQNVAEGEPVELLVQGNGAPGSTLELQWTRDGQTIGSSSVEVGPEGLARGRWLDAAPPAGPHVYQARTNGTASPVRTMAMVSGTPQVLVLTTDAEVPTLLCDAMEHAGARVQVHPIGESEPDAATLSGVDLVVLADLPLARTGEVTLLPGLSTRGQELLLEYARNGGGVIVTGGSYGFSPEWAGTPLARMLPVEIDDEGEVQDPRMAMAIMLDRSGSMAAMAGGHSKMTLAVEASLAAASTLRPDDLVAIASVDTVTGWSSPLGLASGLPARQAAIRAITAGGGGIYVYTALADAYVALRAASVPVRHVVLFSDTADSEEQFQGCPFAPCDPAGDPALHLARLAREAGITTSVVGIGSETDQDTRFLRDLAATAGGRFYLTSHATDLRRIFISETRAASRSNLRTEPVRLARASDHPILEGIDVGAMPAILGYDETERRATADTLLVTPDDRPILASWRYGLGRVVAFTTEAGGEWTAEWAAWPGAGQLFRQMGRHATRRRAGAGVDAQLVLRGVTAELTIDVPHDAAPPAVVELYALSDTGASKAVQTTLERVAPGRWVARGTTGGEPLAFARIQDAGGSRLAEVAGQQDSAAERQGLGPDERALRQLARAGQGRYAPSPTESLRPGGPRGREPLPSWPTLLLLAAALVAVDVWARRLPVRGRSPRPASLASVPPAAKERQRIGPEG